MDKNFCDRYKAIGVGISCGSPTLGSEKASISIINKLKDMGHNFDFSFLSTSNLKDKSEPLLISKNYVADLNKKLFGAVCDCYESNKIPFIIGGDHSLSIGTVAGSFQRYGNKVVVVWVDAHTDINTHITSHSHYIHGMPNAVSLGLMDEGLSPIHRESHLKPNQLAFLGARSIDDGEYAILQENGIFYLNVSEVLTQGVDNVVAQIKQISKADYVHISFDVDCLNPKEFSATGYNIDNGFSVQNVKDIFSSLKKHFTLALFECVEYNPDLDKDGKDLNTVVDLIMTALK